MAGNKLDRVFARTPHDMAEGRLLRGVHAPQNPNISQTSAQSRQVYPWWVEKIPSAQDFNVQDFAITLGAGVGSQATSTGLNFKLPSAFIGVIQLFGIYILTPDATTAIQFTLRVNQMPVSGWDNIQFPPGAANFVVQNFSDLRVKVPQGGVVDVLITNLAATGPWTVGGKVAGWYNPTSDAQRVSGLDY